MQAVRKKKLIMMHIKDTINEVISYEYIKQTTAKMNLSGFAMNV